MSGEFGDNVSISSRRRSVAVADDGNVSYLFVARLRDNLYIYVAVSRQVPELPPEEEGSSKFSMLDPMHMKALIWKNFLWMWRNVG